MRHRKVPLRTLILGIGLPALLACALPGFLLWQSLPVAELQRARERWAVRAFTHYKWRVVIHQASGSCLQDIEVQDERVLDSFPYPSPDCDIPPQTITQFFDIVQRYIENPRCGRGGCACDGPIGVTVTYDSQLGYPLRLERKLRPQLRWLHLDYWKGQLTGLPACRPFGFVRQEIKVSHLTPLP